MELELHDEIDERTKIPVPPRRRQGSSQRRQSLPARSYTAPEHPYINNVHLQPASPEVISSLISSFSTISTPVCDHPGDALDASSQTAPSSPSFIRTELPRDDSPPPTGSGFGMDYGAYKLPDESDPDLDDNAAAPPVVRMAKPSSRSQSRRSSVSGKRESSHARSGSKASYASSHNSKDVVSGFGIVSLEPGPRQSTTSIASSSSGGRKSLKPSMNLLKKRSSRDFSKEKEFDRLSVTDGRRLGHSKSRLSIRSSPSMPDLREEGSSDIETQTSCPSTARRDSAFSVISFNNVADSTFNGSIGGGRMIPTRESSLRHKKSPKRRRSTRHSLYSNRDFKIDGDIAEVHGENDQAAKQSLGTTTTHHGKKGNPENRQPTQQPTTPKLSPKSSLRHVTPSNVPKQRDSASLEQPQVNRVRELSFDLEESAPSPTVQTRRVSSVKKRTSGPLASKTTNIQPMVGKQDKLDSPFKNNKRNSNTGSIYDTKSHRRISSALQSSGDQNTLGPEERVSSSDPVDDAVRAYITAPRLTQKLQHPQTGRIIAFSEVGDPNGHVVFCCVGMGLTRYLIAFYDELARTLKLRLITPDRPGIGESEPCLDGSGPLSWPDDLAIICSHLKISKFSMLAHSAGAIYALATALRMPQHIRGRLHLLAPWIPPSQMSGMGSHKDPLPANALPYSQRILRALPTPILKVANSRFMTATSASVSKSPKSRKNKRLNPLGKDKDSPPPDSSSTAGSEPGKLSVTGSGPSTHRPSQDVVSRATSDPSDPKAESAVLAAALAARADRERQSEYDNRLTHAIWELATTNANPAVDLLICLERRQNIGFRYNDISRSVVIHHGSKDTRVPVDNVRWLGKTMRRCEVRVLEDEGHGLMASATVMGNVLMEMAKEWEDWTTVVQGR